MGEKKRDGKIKGIVIFLVVCLAFGVLLFTLMETVLKEFMNVYIKSESVFIGLLKFYSLILILILCFFIQIIIHECGHLIFGFITGYSFVSFRIGSLTLIKEEGRWKRKRFSIPGTGGQCLMMPPEMEEGRFPFVIYNFGGAIFRVSIEWR